MKFLNNLKFAPRVAFDTGKTPMYLIFFATSRCNMRCEHCFYWDELNRKEDEITLKEIEKISKTMDPLLLLRITGGEPFLRRDIPEIIEIFYKNTRLRNVGINTNGYFTDRILHDVQKILEAHNIGLDICVSVDDIPEHHDKNRDVKGSFEKVTKTIDGLNELKKKYPTLTITAGMTVTAENQNRLPEIFEQIKKINPTFISGNLIRGTPKKLNLKNLDIENYRKFISLIREYNASKNHNFFLSAKLKDKMQSNIIAKTYLTGEYQGINCVAGDKAAVLYSNGDVFPCELLNEKIGSLRDINYDFRKIWDTERRQKVASQIVNEKCFCTHECFLSSSVWLKPKNLIVSAQTLMSSSQK